MSINQEIQGLANVVRLAAQLFRRELTAERAATLEQRDVLRTLAEERYDLQRGHLGDADFLRKLRAEYTRIFIGPGPHIHPYGSVHHPDDDKKGRLWGDTSIWVRRFAMDHGLEFAGDHYDGIPDHVGHELEIYAHLLEAELRALQSGDEGKVERLRNSERLFLTKQLLRWVPEFCDRVRKAAKLPFYGELARLTQDLLKLEQTRLAQHSPDEGHAAEADSAAPASKLETGA